MENLNENLQKAVDVILNEETAKKVSDIILKAQNENLTAEESAMESDKYITELIMPFYEPHKNELTIDTFKYLILLPKKMRTFYGYAKLADNKPCEIKIKKTTGNSVCPTCGFEPMICVGGKYLCEMCGTEKKNTKI